MLEKTNTPYLPRTSGARWAIGRMVGQDMVHLVQDTLADEGVPENVLRALGIVPTPANLDHYFPILRTKEGIGRCPTLERLELFAHLGATGREVGV